MQTHGGGNDDVKDANGYDLLNKAISSKELTNDKVMALTILYLTDLISHVIRELKSRDKKNIKISLLDGLVNDIEAKLKNTYRDVEKNKYRDVQDVWRVCNSTIIEANKILDKSFPDLVNAYLRSLGKDDAIEAQEMLRPLLPKAFEKIDSEAKPAEPSATNVEEPVNPPARPLPMPTLLGQIVKADPWIARCVDKIDHYDQKLKTSKMQKLKDKLYWSPKHEKNTNEKLRRSLEFRTLLTNLQDKEASEGVRIGTLKRLIDLTDEKLESSRGIKTKFNTILQNDMQPLINHLSTEIEKKVDINTNLKNAGNNPYNNIIFTTLRNNKYKKSRKAYASRLQRYIDTINFDAPIGMHYIQNAARIFTHLINPHKKDRLLLFLKGVQSDISAGNINKDYFDDKMKDFLASVSSTNSEVISILAELKQQFESHKDECGFTGIHGENNIEVNKHRYVLHEIEERFHWYSNAHGIARTEMFTENPELAGMAAIFVASVDLKALNALAPGISLAQDAVVTGLELKDEADRARKHENAGMVSYKMIDETGRAFAKLFVERFAVQIDSLYFSSNYTKTLDDLVDSAVRYAINNLHKIKGKYNLPENPTAEQYAIVLLQSMLVPEDYRIITPGFLPFRPGKLDHIHDKGFTGNKNRKWTIDGMFQRTGYVKHDGEKLVFYKPPGSRPEKYGYAFVIGKEAEQLNLLSPVKLGIDERKEYEDAYNSRIRMNKETPSNIIKSV